MNLGLARRRETVDRTKEALATLGIEHLAEREPRRLSGGQAQLVVIASLLAMRPAHLVLDEPTAQLDPEGTRLVGEALRGARRDRDGPADRRAQDGPARRAVQPDRRRSTAGGSSLDGAAAEVLADPRLEALGRRAAVARPAGVAPLAARGLDPALVARAIGRDALALRGRRLRLPGRDAGAATGSTSTIAAGRDGRDRRPERQRQVDARPPPRRPAPPDRGPGPPRRRRRRRRAGRGAGRRGRDRLPEPGSADLRRQGPERRSRSARASSGRPAAAVAAAVERRPRRPSGWPSSQTRTRTTSATRGGSCSRSRRSSRWRRRSSSSTSRRPARTPAASPGSRRSSRELARSRPHGHRDQPRHAVRGRDLRPRRRDGRRPDPRSTARRPRSSPRRPGRALASTVPRAAARRAGRCAARARLHPDRAPARGASGIPVTGVTFGSYVETRSRLSCPTHGLARPDPPLADPARARRDPPGRHGVRVVHAALGRTDRRRATRAAHPAPSGAPSGAPAAGPTAAPTLPPMAKARWTDCGKGFQCASIRVPRDYDDLTAGLRSTSRSCAGRRRTARTGSDRWSSTRAAPAARASSSCATGCRPSPRSSASGSTSSGSTRVA